jgi:hypothetical protein
MGAALAANPHTTAECTGMWRNGLYNQPLVRGERLSVRHDVGNPKDPNACSLLRGDAWVAFLPACTSRILAGYLDAGHEVEAYVLEPGGDEAWSLVVALVGAEPVQALQIGREYEEAFENEDEVPLWRPPESASQRADRQRRGWENEVKRRCGRRAIDIFVALGAPEIPRYLGVYKHWQKVNLDEVYAPEKPAFDQDLGDEIPFVRSDELYIGAERFGKTKPIM